MSKAAEHGRLIGQLEALYAERIKTMRKLQCAIAIAELLGVEPKDLTGKVSSAVVDDPKVDLRFRKDPWCWQKLHVTREGYETVSFPLASVPHCLWPKPSLVAYEKAKLASQKKALEEPQ